jgi:hypothetical protein
MRGNRANPTSATQQEHRKSSVGIGALGALRTARRTNRLQDIHWSDSLYRGYVVVVASAFLLSWASSTLGSQPVGASALDEVRSRFGAIVGLIMALLFGAAVRSGSRGGPLGIEAADLTHVLQAPIDRRLSLQRPFVHQIRRGLFQGFLVGGGSGVLVDPFLPAGVPAWMLTLAILGAIVGLVSIGIAGVASTLRLPRHRATAIGAAAVLWSGLDVARELRTSPLTFLGAGAKFPLTNDSALVKALPFVLLAGLAALATSIAWRNLGNVSLELVERRTALVSQLRFAVTTQDLRTAMLLRRQLTSERSRQQPWFRLKGRGGPNAAVVIRGLRNIARWPRSRVLRLLFGSVLAGFAARGAWDGAVPLIGVTGLVLFVLSLDALEAMAQDADHPDLAKSFPRHLGRLANRQTVAPALVMTIVGLIVGVSTSLSGLITGSGIAARLPSTDRLTTVAITFGVSMLVGISASLFALAGAALNLSLGPPSFMMMLQTPEMAYARSAIAPGLAIAGSALPYFLIRASLRSIKTRSAIPGVFQSMSATALVVYMVLTVLTSRGVLKSERA